MDRRAEGDRMNTFKPTRKELREVQRLATECEIDARATANLFAGGVTQWYGMHRPAEYSEKAFQLSRAVHQRATAVRP